MVSPGTIAKEPAANGRSGEEVLVALLREKALLLAAAESCTGGLVADRIVRVPGASGVFWGSFVCYTPEAKINMLGVSGGILGKYGLVSAETAAAMAEGALGKSGADAAVSVTGLAGPEGDLSGVPVGTVWVGTALKNGPVQTVIFHLTGSRNELRNNAALEAVNQILKQVQEFF
ncbi:MAG: nicotinamide-nucleotide amidohydrolase family protein [Treponema sp.]|jgi:PncC family amidohydrolase|nr:nicotinamide-nucleotide amidohydrolase family protein [Treponema sp.]